MKDIIVALQERLEQKNLTALSVGAFVMHQVKQLSKSPDECSAYIKRNILHITLAPDDDKTKRFITRETLKGTINDTLSQHGYEQQIKEIRFW